ncbi:MAG: hypothetical protein ACXW11_08910 [Methylotenera sp.]
MNSLRLRWSAIAFVIGLFTLLSSGCIVTSDGYGYYGGVGVGLGYYEPYNTYYGGWGPTYRVGPPYGGGYHQYRGSRSYPHTYRSAPSSRSMPSIPSRPRHGGSRFRSGGGRSH